MHTKNRRTVSNIGQVTSTDSGRCSMSLAARSPFIFSSTAELHLICDEWFSRASAVIQIGRSAVSKESDGPLNWPPNFPLFFASTNQIDGWDWYFLALFHRVKGESIFLKKIINSMERNIVQTTKLLPFQRQKVGLFYNFLGVITHQSIAIWMLYLLAFQLKKIRRYA